MEQGNGSPRSRAQRADVCFGITAGSLRHNRMSIAPWTSNWNGLGRQLQQKGDEKFLLHRGKVGKKRVWDFGTQNAPGLHGTSG